MAQVTVLLYEDQNHDAEIIIKEFHLQANAMGIEASIMWIQKPFEPFIDSSHLKPWTHWLPLQFMTNQVPLIISQNNEREIGKKEWWQSEFDAAILDVYYTSSEHLPTETHKLGEELAEWLNHARFQGPVVLSSLYDLPPEPFPFLPHLKCFPKNIDWGKKAAGIVISELKGRQSINETETLKVGLYGRNPMDNQCIARFWRHLARNAGDSQEKKQTSLWVGDCTETAQTIAEIFCQTHLSQSVLRGRKLWKDPILDYWPNVVENICAAKGVKKTEVVWVDLGESADFIKLPWVDSLLLTDQAENLPRSLKRNREINPKAEQLKKFEELESKVPLVVVLAKRLSQFTEQIQDKLLYYGVIVLDRNKILRAPGQWAVETVECFIAWLELYRKENANLTSQAIVGPNKEVAKQRLLHIKKGLLRAYLRLFLIARADNYIRGSKDSPSIISWLSAYPLSGEAVRTSWPKIKNQLLKDLHDEQCISVALLKMLKMKGISRDD